MANKFCLTDHRVGGDQSLLQITQATFKILPSVHTAKSGEKEFKFW